MRTLDEFGEGALFDEQKRSATAVAKNDLQLLVLKRTDMENFDAVWTFGCNMHEWIGGSKRRQSKNVLVLKQTVTEV